MKKLDDIQRPGALIEDLLSENPLMATIKLARYKFAARMLSKDDIVLDLGCGSGLSSHFFSSFCQNVIGLDASDEHQQYWDKLQNNKLSFVYQDVFSMSIEQPVTAIINLDFIEHFTKEDGAKIIKNSMDILHRSNGGMFICGTPSRFSSSYRAEHNKAHHLHEYEPDELHSLCREYFPRCLQFSMNDEVVHTGFNKLAWYTFVIGFSS